MTSIPSPNQGRFIGGDERAWEALEALIDAVNEHDTYTGGHSFRAADYAASVATAMGYRPEAVDRIRKAGLLHDVGKVGVPEQVLQKPGPLDDHERELIKLHPVLGASILEKVEEAKGFAGIILHHHERWDGEGYPEGLAGDEIPAEARVIFVADAYDAMTSERPYGGVKTTEEALAEIKSCAGQQFEPAAVEGLHRAHRLGLLEDHAPPQISLLDD